MFYVYVLYSNSNKRFYIGQTSDIRKRLLEHNKGKVKATKPYIPYTLLYYELFENREDAILREKELKKSPGRRYLRQYLKTHPAGVAELVDAPDSKSGEAQTS